jgi:hypothetical protein
LEVFLIRTLITLSTEDKEWLDSYSHLNHQSTAETIRQAINNFHEEIKKESKKNILKMTSGLYKTQPQPNIDDIRRSK